MSRANKLARYTARILPAILLIGGIITISIPILARAASGPTAGWQYEYLFSNLSSSDDYPWMQAKSGSTFYTLSAGLIDDEVLRKKSSDQNITYKITAPGNDAERKVKVVVKYCTPHQGTLTDGSGKTSSITIDVAAENFKSFVKQSVKANHGEDYAPTCTTPVPPTDLSDIKSARKVNVGIRLRVSPELFEISREELKKLHDPNNEEERKEYNEKLEAYKDAIKDSRIALKSMTYNVNVYSGTSTVGGKAASLTAPVSFVVKDAKTYSASKLSSDSGDDIDNAVDAIIGSDSDPDGGEADIYIPSAKTKLVIADDKIVIGNYLLNTKEFPSRYTYFKKEKNKVALTNYVFHAVNSSDFEKVIDAENTSIGDPDGSGDSQESADACGSGSGGGALRWILCPIASAINDGIFWVTKEIIGPSLQMSPLESGGTLYTAWQGLRNTANAFLIVLFLFIIFASVITNGDNAYTIKKALPRIVAAAIFIQASYFLCAIVVDIGNVLGAGVGTLITSAIGGAGGTGSSVGQNIASGLLGATVLVGGGIVATILGAWILLLPLAIGLIISILTLLLSLGTRLIALNLLIMLAPIAILAWILPNTEKYFKMWTSNFLKLVMMYPLIIAIMASAQVVVKVGAGDSNSTFAGVLTLFAPMIAFFMIPATFRMSGTILSGINGAIASRGKALSGATAGALRRNSMQDIKDKAAVKLYDTQGKKTFGRAVARVASGNAFSFGTTGQRKIRKTQEEGLAKRTELRQDEWREKQNKPLMEELLAERATGKLSRSDELGMLDLIASRGGTLELADYFAQLESEGKVTRGAKGGVEHIDDEIWGQLNKKHSAAIAAALPHTTGKAMQSQDGGGLNKAKGEHPANEMLREFATMDAGAKNQVMQQFYDAAQRDDAGSMDKSMVRALQSMITDTDAGDTTFTMSDGSSIQARDFFTNQINNGRLTRFVQPS